MKNLVWLASYPKSGNTWLRLFLANYLVDSGRPVPINHAERYSTGDSVVQNYQAVSKPRPFNPLDDRLALQLRDKVFRSLSGNGASVNLIKTHCKNKRIEGIRLIPPHLTRAGIYIVRNPLDMLVSYADHYGRTNEETVSEIADPHLSILPGAASVRQFTGNWSDHVRSWTKNPKFPLTVLRYEDMLADPQTAFEKVIAALGAPLDTERVSRAIAASSFAEVRKQEDVTGFNEKSDASERFFRSGKSGEGRQVLPTEIVESIGKTHGEVMRQFGYLE